MSSYCAQKNECCQRYKVKFANDVTKCYISYKSHEREKGPNKPGLTLKSHRKNVSEGNYLVWASSLYAQAEVSAIALVREKQFYPAYHTKGKASTAKQTCLGSGHTRISSNQNTPKSSLWCLALEAFPFMSTAPGPSLCITRPQSDL